MSELTEDQKLVKLGLRSPNQTQSAGVETIESFKENIAESFETFQENFEDANISSWGAFETWLQSNGISASESASIRQSLEQKYSSFSEFSDVLLNDLDSWNSFENEFASNTGLRSDRQTGSGLSAAGIKVYEESGVGRSGQSIPAGGVEVYGKEVHFSQSSAVQDTKEESAGTSDPIVWDNLSVSPTGLRIGDIVTVEADVTNNTGFVGNVVAELILDGTVIDKKTRELPGNTTITVTFEYTAGAFGTGTFDIGISKAGTTQIQVIYGGL